MASRCSRHLSGHHGSAGVTVFHTGRGGAGGGGGGVSATTASTGAGAGEADGAPADVVAKEEVSAWGVESTGRFAIGRYGTIVMPGGGGGSVMLPPSATAPTFALVCFTLAETKRKNALNASGDMSCIWITISVTCLSTSTSA